MLLDDAAAYQKWLADVVARDLAEGVLGFARSPVKAALDILRELRDTFRYAVDFGGLTSGSLDEFTRTTIPALNRAVVGPQFERYAELLALLAARVVQAPFGPTPAVTRATRPAAGRSPPPGSGHPARWRRTGGWPPTWRCRPSRRPRAP